MRQVTLVWHDYPAAGNAVSALVNDLNLVVLSPSNVSYVGNARERGLLSQECNQVRMVTRKSSVILRAERTRCMYVGCVWVVRCMTKSTMWSK